MKTAATKAMLGTGLLPNYKQDGHACRFQSEKLLDTMFGKRYGCNSGQCGLGLTQGSAKFCCIAPLGDSIVKTEKTKAVRRAVNY